MAAAVVTVFGGGSVLYRKGPRVSAVLLAPSPFLFCTEHQPSLSHHRLPAHLHVPIAVSLFPLSFPTPKPQAVSDGGLLCVTATDMAVLCGNTGEACYAKYGSYPLHRAYGHEQGIRILLACLESNAARHKRYIVPLLR